MTTKRIIPAYLYQQYADDEDLAAFVSSYNALAQKYLNWFNQINLPVYTEQSGDLLDWVAAGFYGFERPSLPFGVNNDIGMPNTFAPNELAPNTFMNAPLFPGGSGHFITSDDTFKRVLTWHYYRGDGRYFDVRWLKRRVLRFLLGIDGTSPDVSDTSRISVTFGPGSREVNINLLTTFVTVLGSAAPNEIAPNEATPNQFDLTSTSVPQYEMAPIFAAAVEAGVLELPFQFTYNVSI